LVARVERFCTQPLVAQGSELTADLIELRRSIDLLELRFAQMSAAFAATDQYDAEGSISPIQWIRHQCHMGGGAAADRVAVGEQRVALALARALAIRPKVLLLDEPLSALDVKVRARLRDEIRRVQLEVGIMTLFVTHDQDEALAIADRVGVMQAGRLEKLDAPTTVYSRPATPFVAEFVGLSNRLAGTVKGGMVEVRGVQIPLVQSNVADGPATALVRSEAISLASDGDIGEGPLVGTVIAVAFLGAVSRVSVDLGDVAVLAQLPTAAASSHPAGSKVRLALRTDPVLIHRG
jgi:putative spermidine/putrescine transport system ATP-binding protein